MLLSVVYTWLFQGTAESILIAGIFHSLGNITGAVLPYWITGPGRWISFGLLLVPAILIGYKMAASTRAEKHPGG